MAVVRDFLPGTQEVGPHPTETDCYYQVVRTGAGGRLLHLSSFGSAGRKEVGKSSQSLQLDKERAYRLAALIFQVFPLSDPVARHGEPL